MEIKKNLERDCGQNHQTMQHIVMECPKIKFNRGMEETQVLIYNAWSAYKNLTLTNERSMNCNYVHRSADLYLKPWAKTFSWVLMSTP